MRIQATRIAWLAAAAALVAAAPAAAIPHFTAYQYQVKVGMKGGANLTSDIPGPASDFNNGDVFHETFKASYSTDETFPGVILVARGTFPGFNGARWTEDRPAVANGTWTASGTKWTDVANGVSGPFECGGPVRVPGGDGTSRLAYRRLGGVFKFTLTVIQELASEGRCPGINGHRGSLAYANGFAWITTFTVPRTALGQKTITRQVSGPQASRDWRQYPCQTAECNFSMAWHAVVKLTRVRTMRF